MKDNIKQIKSGILGLILICIGVYFLLQKYDPEVIFKIKNYYLELGFIITGILFITENGDRLINWFFSLLKAIKDRFLSKPK